MKTASGKPILCSDPHLGFHLPAVWYTCHLAVNGQNLAGVTFPGGPAVVIGHTDRHAWGMTNLQSDAVDYFVEKEGLLMAPAYAVPQMLAEAQLRLQDFDFYEIHEAFAGQVLCTLAAWSDASFCREKLGLAEALGSIDRSRLNVNGGSIAVGHPFAATGARIVATLAKTLDEAKAKRGLISVCTAGGMGVTAILER